MTDQIETRVVNAAGMPLDWLDREIATVFTFRDELWAMRDGVCVMRIFNIGERSAEARKLNP